jgi:4-alpha-glucanotransferase
MGSIANTVIIPMQDVLGLGEEARMNTPSVSRGNWAWRLAPNMSLTIPSERLLELTEIYGRAL